MIGPGGKTTAQRHVIYIVVDQHALTMYFDISSFRRQGWLNRLLPDVDGGYAPTLKVARIASHIEAPLRDNKFIRYFLLGRIDMRELESVSSRSVVPPPQGFWADVIGGYAAGALTKVAAGHLAAGIADAEYDAVAIADDLAFGGIIGALGAALKETRKERAFYLEGLVDREARSSP